MSRTIDIQYVGHDLCRTMVRSRPKRERLGRIEGVTVDADRVYFPKWMASQVRRILVGRPRPRADAQQLTIGSGGL